MHPRRLRTPPPPHPVILTLPCPFPQECPPPHCRAVLLCPHVDSDLYEGAVTPNTARPAGLRPRSHPVQLGGTHEGAGARSPLGRGRASLHQALTCREAAAGAHGAAGLRAGLGDGGDTDRAAEHRPTFLRPRVLKEEEKEKFFS